MQCKECLNKFSVAKLVCLKYPQGVPEEILFDYEKCGYIKKEEIKEKSLNMGD